MNLLITMNKIIRHIYTLIFVFFLAVPVFGDVFFSGLDLYSDNRLLFNAHSGYEGSSLQSTLFITDLSENQQRLAIQQLTAFPEKIELLGYTQGSTGNASLFIRNAFGAVRVPLTGGLPIPVSGLPVFLAEDNFYSVRSAEMVPSPCGTWLLYLEPVSPATGNLILLNMETGQSSLVSSGIDKPDSLFPAAWSLDSRYFIYEKDGYLYFLHLSSFFTITDENQRYIGEGKINSIRWDRGGNFYYLRDFTLYTVWASRLFTASLYTDFLEAGTIAGNIPFEFDPWLDDYWLAPDGNSIIISRNKRALFYFPLGSGSQSNIASLPYLSLPRLSSNVEVLWSVNGVVTVLVYTESTAGTSLNTWRLGTSAGRSAVFERISSPAGNGSEEYFSSGSLSPDGRTALFWGKSGIILYDYINWRIIDTVSQRPGLDCLWVSNNEFIAGDDLIIESIRLSSSNSISDRNIISLSQAQQFGFEESTGNLLIKAGEHWYISNGRSPWLEISLPAVRNASLYSDQFRVYLERQNTGFYINVPMVRILTGTGTFAVINNNSSRGRGDRRIALSFDLYDDDTGLAEVLAALSRFNINATFFLNGEFIRRHPEAAVEITALGHETASMFYVPIDLSNQRYRTGGDFVPRGLARNEDEFFRATGRELSLLWHAPWYISSPEINSAAARAGYLTVNRDFDPMDWVSREEAMLLGIHQYSPSRMIDNIMESLGSNYIVPIRLGVLSGGRNGYIFNSINVLLDALVRGAYTLTTVSEVLSYR